MASGRRPGSAKQATVIRGIPYQHGSAFVSVAPDFLKRHPAIASLSGRGTSQLTGNIAGHIFRSGSSHRLRCPRRAVDRVRFRRHAAAEIRPTARFRQLLMTRPATASDLTHRAPKAIATRHAPAANAANAAYAAVAWLALLSGAETASGQQPSAGGIPRSDLASVDAAESSVEQGSTPIEGTFEESREWRLAQRRAAFQDTKVQFDLRSMFIDRHTFDGAENEAWAIGGWAGVKTGFFLDHIALAATAYTSQPLYAPANKDGTQLLETGQGEYSVLGELYADVRITDDLNLYGGRKGFDTPYINRNDTRMTPNTFEAVALQGRTELGDNCGALKYGIGYFDKIKERNSDEFVSMAVAAGAKVDRGVDTAGILYQNGPFSLGAVDSFCPDIINIGYLEAKMELPLGDDLKLRLAAQYSDQRSVGEDLLTGNSFWARQFGLKAEVPVGRALFTAAYTAASGNANMQSPWSGYPGYTSVQIQNFNRDGEDALLLRAGYKFACVEGLSAYALGVFGSPPNQAGQYRQDECDLNVQWAASSGMLKGLALRLRYAVAEQHGGNVDHYTDLRVMCNYTRTF